VTSRGLRLLAVSLVALALAIEGTAARAQRGGVAGETCLTCHFGIEEMHPWEPLSCTDCHGGDGTAETMERAHVAPKKPLPADERVLPLDWPDRAYLRFVNPTNLRIVDETCGTCHGGLCEDLRISLHGTTAGHLSDGMYEAGIIRDRGSRFAMFGVEKSPEQDSPHGLDRLFPLPSFDPKAPRERFATHYQDLAPKNCVRCHLYAPGVAVRGRLGLDGDYRSEGCAACHVVYANDGLSKSGDPTIDRFEPGHPIRHEMTAAVPTENCTHCHYGDASIGLGFRGLAQLHPGQPAGPQVPGTTDAQLNRAFYIDDPKIVPPDVHHDKGMHCIDCHTLNDVMGDGTLYGSMPQAVEIECQDCHGTIDAPSGLKTSRGNPLAHLSHLDGQVFLTSKVTGKKHLVKQVAHVVNPRHPDYNERAAAAMTNDHERLECYACHGSWSPNFYGFHFDRQEQFTQLDMMSGERTAGRVNTQEKVFSTFRGFHLGFNSDRMIAPYMVGFSSMGSVSAPDGTIVLDQVMPVTAAGLSGMTLIHHQLHTNRKQARACADCHRSGSALGLGSPASSFSLSRGFFVAASTRGLDVFALDRKRPGDSTPIANLPLLGVIDVVLDCEPLQGHARRAYLAVEGRGVAVVDLSNPALPRQSGFVATDDPRGLHFAAGKLYVADGRAGVKVIDVGKVAPQLLGAIATPDARALALHWPHLHVADYEQGLVVIDVTNPAAPSIVATLDVVGGAEGATRARAIALLDQPSRPDDGTGEGRRSRMRILVGLACEGNGFHVADVTEPKQPLRLPGFAAVAGFRPRAGVRVAGVAASMHVDLGSPDGAIETRESDYFYVTVAAENRDQGRLVTIDASDVLRPKLVGSARLTPDCGDLALVKVYNPPFLQSYAIVASGERLEIVDLTRSAAPIGAGQFGGLRGAAAIAVESFAFDRLIDEAGVAQKDISHADSRYFTRQEIDRILRAEVPVRPGIAGDGGSDPQRPETGGGSRSEPPRNDVRRKP
jgi:hypothetical protein